MVQALLLRRGGGRGKARVHKHVWESVVVVIEKGVPVAEREGMATSGVQADSEKKNKKKKIQVSFTIGQVSAELMKDRSNAFRKAMMQQKMASRGQSPSSASLVRFRMGVQDTIPSVPVLRAAITGIQGKITLNPEPENPLEEPTMDVALILHSLSVIDVRPAARLFYYRHLLAPAPEAKRMAVAAAKTERRKKINLSPVVENNRSSMVDDGSESEEEEQYNIEKEEPLLALTFVANQTTGVSDVKIILTDFSSFVIVPSIHATIEVALEVAEAILFMLAGESPRIDVTNDINPGYKNLPKDPPRKSKPGFSQQRSEENMTPKSEKQTMNINVELVRPSLV